MDTMNLPENVVRNVAEQAVAFYLGNVSSVEAYANIDGVTLSWVHEARTLNETRALFDALVTYMIDFDVDTWGALASVGDTREFAEAR